MRAQGPDEGDEARAGGLPSFTRLVRRLTRPRLYTVDGVTLLEVAPPPALAALVPDLFDFEIAALETVDQPAAVTCFQRAIRVGAARANVRFRGAPAPSLLAIVDLVTDLGVIAYLVSDDLEPVGPLPAAAAVVARSDATASVVLTAGGRIVEVLGAIPGVLDEARPEVVGSSLAALVHPADRETALTAFAAALSDHRLGRHVRARLRTTGGDWRWVDSTLFAGSERPDGTGGGGEGQVVVSCSITDAEGDVRARAAVAESEDRFRMLAESIPIGVFEADDIGRIRFANDTFRDITGVDDGTDWLDLTHPDDRAAVDAAIQRFGFGGDVLDVEVRLRPRGAATYRTARVLARAIRADDGKLLDVVGSMEDITDRKALQVRLSHAAAHDPLTGLANRAHLMAELDRRLTASFSARDPLAVLFVDLDGFKRVNDSLGHSAGDRLLLAMADRLRTQARTGDLVSRFGGDEFVVVAEQTGGPDGALGMARRVLQVLSQPLELAGVQLRPRASIGVALAAERDTDTETLLRDADAAMYEAKVRGANAVWLADAAVRGRADRRFGLERGIAEALAGDEYRLDYQPVVDLATGMTVGAEGLLRWDSDEFGTPTPGEIIPLAEETGLVHELSEWSARRAARDLLEVRARSQLTRRFQLGINLSCAQLSSPSLVDRYLGVLADVGVAPADLVLEVTETELVEEGSVAEQSLVTLAASGAQVAIDDFGAGYSSFDYLTRMPVSFLKIDRRLTRALPTNSRARRVLRALVAMCADMEVAVVAEGIEAVAERCAYLDIGIEFGQGFLFSPAVSVDGLVARLQAEVGVTR